MGSWIRKCCWKTHDLLKLVVHKVPCLNALFLSRYQENRWLKFFTGCCYGLVLGFGFYALILVDLDFTPDICILTAMIITIMLAIGNAVSVQIRCITLLMLPAFCGRAGRSVLKALVIAYALAGPLANLAANGRDVVRVFACTTTLTYNLTRTRFDLMVRPFIDGLLHMKADVSEAKQTLRSMRDVMEPVSAELEGQQGLRQTIEENDYLDAVQGDSKRSEEIERKFAISKDDSSAAAYDKQYAKKLEHRCQDLLSRSGERCRRAFADAYDRCYHKVSFLAAWLLCWPMKLNFVCNVVAVIGGEKTCDVAKHLDSGIGEGYLYLKRTRDQLNKGFQEAKMQYKLARLPPNLDVREAKDTAQAVMHEFDSRKKFADHLMSVVKRFLALAFIRIVLGAQHYHDRYLTDIQHDNVYVTRYFRRIDARRRRREQLTLLPLRKSERARFVDPVSLCPAPRERVELLPSTLRLVLEMLTPTAFLLMDLLLYEAMDLVRRHARVEYAQTGKHDLMLRVVGTGMIAKLVRSILQHFNFRQRVRAVRSNAECLPRPVRLNRYYYYKIFGSYLLIWLLLFTQAFTSRLQRATCAYFYPKREKRRVLFLYNETLKRRIGLARHLKARVRRRAREQRLAVQASFLAAIRVRCPAWCAWLRVFRVARRQCLVCAEAEPFSQRRRRELFTDCPTPTCFALYCNVCWREAGETCYVCGVHEDSDSEAEDSAGGDAARDSASSDSA